MSDFIQESIGVLVLWVTMVMIAFLMGYQRFDEKHTYFAGFRDGANFMAKELGGEKWTN